MNLLEFCGLAIEAMPMYDRFVFANMTIECGGKNGGGGKSRRHTSAKVYLVSPAVAAATAIRGTITDSRPSKLVK